jgi:hypothetical protein
MIKWEYKAIRKELSEAELNELGCDGWELIAVGTQAGGWSGILYFKRPLAG